MLVECYRRERIIIGIDCKPFYYNRNRYTCEAINHFNEHDHKYPGDHPKTRGKNAYNYRPEDAYVF